MHSLVKRLSIAACACAMALFAGCDDDNTPVGPPKGTPGIHALFGAGVTDTIDTPLVQALVVEVRDTDGELVPDVVVRFQSQAPADSSRRSETAVYVCPLSAPTCGAGGSSVFAAAITDARGRSSALVRLGTVAGRAVVRISVPELGLVDSVVYTVTPGVATRVRAVAADTALDLGTTAALRGRVVDRYNNTRTEAVTTVLGGGSALTLNASTGVVTAVGAGLQYVYSRVGTLADSTLVRVVPVGRLVVWVNGSNTVRMVDISGKNSRVLLMSLSSDYGVFPQFDATRQRITLHANPNGSGQPTAAIVVDTTGTPRRDVGAQSGLTLIVSVRGLADGSLAVVGRRSTDTGFSLFKIAPDNALTFVAALPGFAPDGIGYGGADISHDGTKVVYVTPQDVRVLNGVTGAVTVLAANGRAPRWSAQDDRVAFLTATSTYDGTLTVIDADGSNRRAVGSTVFSPGITWSPDSKFIIGRSPGGPIATLMLLQVSDGAAVPLKMPEDYFQPDWR